MRFTIKTVNQTGAGYPEIRKSKKYHGKVLLKFPHTKQGADTERDRWDIRK